MDPKKYLSATAFRRALEDRLKNISGKEKIALQRLRRQVAFDRLLARFFNSNHSPWVLKGGYAMELRISTARATKDVDLTMRKRLSINTGSSINQNTAIRELLQEHASVDLHDYFTYTIGQAMMDLTAPIYGGARFPVEARMDLRTFAQFHVDVALGDPLIEPLEVIRGRDWLEFAGIPASELHTISREQQLAEKLHAYTLPRQNPNSRVRDLVDMVLLIESTELSKDKIGRALRITFERRQTHPMPKEILPPPAAWTVPFAALAKECGMKEDVGYAFATVKSFIDNLVR